MGQLELVSPTNVSQPRLTCVAERATARQKIRAAAQVP
jgi:hypothetical protein